MLILIGIVFYSLSHRYYVSGNYVIDRFTGQSRLIYDTLVKTPTPTPSPAPSKTPWTAESVREARGDSEDNKGDFSKVVISGEAVDTSNPYMYIISCTVKNNDSVSHNLRVKAIFYDKDNNPILTEESLTITVEPNDIESATITAFDNVESIASYELKLVQSESKYHYLR